MINLIQGISSRALSAIPGALFSCPAHLGVAMKVTVNTLREMKDRGEKITMLTAYDFPTARMVDAAGVDTILVGDSLGNVVLGYANTLPVTMDEMIHHARAVARGVERAFLVFDMPFMSYQTGARDAVMNAGRAVKETGAECVKLEGGGAAAAEAAAAIVEAGIPVCGHIGLTPQSVNAMGGFKVQGKGLGHAKRLVDEAVRLEEAGACMVVLECVPAKLAALITERLAIPTIGIGAGAGCDGQVLVFHDMMNISGRRAPKFVKMFADANKVMAKGLKSYVSEVRGGVFPDAAHSFEMDDSIIRKLGGGAPKGAKAPGGRRKG